MRLVSSSGQLASRSTSALRSPSIVPQCVYVSSKRKLAEEKKQEELLSHVINLPLTFRVSQSLGDKTIGIARFQNSSRSVENIVVYKSFSLRSL